MWWIKYYCFMPFIRRDEKFKHKFNPHAKGERYMRDKAMVVVVVVVGLMGSLSHGQWMSGDCLIWVVFPS